MSTSEKWASGIVVLLIVTMALLFVDYVSVGKNLNECQTLLDNCDKTLLPFITIIEKQDQLIDTHLELIEKQRQLIEKLQPQLQSKRGTMV